MRPGEVEGKDYFFISEEEFVRMIENQEFLEYADVFGMNKYGTPRKFVERMMDEGRDVFLDIDVVGAMNVKKAMDEALMIFVMPPRPGGVGAAAPGPKHRDRGANSKASCYRRSGDGAGSMVRLYRDQRQLGRLRPRDFAYH